MRPDPFEIAVEHVAWCIRQGMHARDVLAALGEPAPDRVTWNDVIWTIAALAGRNKALGSTDDRVTVWPPFRAPAARRAA